MYILSVACACVCLARTAVVRIRRTNDGCVSYRRRCVCCVRVDCGLQAQSWWWVVAPVCLARARGV